MTNNDIENQYSPPTRNRTIAASILTYSFDSQGKMHVLLGKEILYHRGSDKYSDFGGRCSKNKQESAEATAAREFVEETACVCKFHKEHEIPYQSSDAVRGMLERNEFIRRYDFPVGRPLTELDENNNTVQIQKVYTTFLQEIPFQTDILSKFQGIMKILWGLKTCQDIRHPAIQQQVQINMDYLEKATIRYFTLQQVRHALYHNNIISYNVTGKHALREHFAKRLMEIVPFLVEIETSRCDSSQKECVAVSTSWREMNKARDYPKSFVKYCSRNHEKNWKKSYFKKKRRFYNFNTFKPHGSSNNTAGQYWRR